MKTILSIFTFFVSLTFNYLNSQILTAEEVMKNAPYVFEGKVVDYSFFKGEGEKVKLSYLIKVENVLKTNSEFFESDTIELVTFAPEGWGITENNELSIMHGDGHESICTGLDLAFNRTGIFFGKSKEGEFASFHTTDRFQMIPFSMYCDAFFSVPSYFHECSEAVTDFVFQGFGQRFEHLNDFNDYLCKNNLKPLSIKKKVERTSNTNLYKLRIFNNDEYQKNLKNRINQNLRKNQEKSQKNITYEIQNQQLTGVNNDFVEFDIVATSNFAGIYIENSAFVISYNSVPFGTNVSASNNVTITNASNYNSSTYMNPMNHITDDTPNAIRFAFGTDYQATSWNRHVLSTTPEMLMHVKFKLLNCQNYRLEQLML